MTQLVQVEDDLWSTPDGSKVISLEDGRYHARDEDGWRATLGSLESAMRFARLIWDLEV